MPIPIPITKTQIATVPWGIPITNEVNRLTTVTTPTAWTPATLQNGWVNTGGSWPVAAYRKIGDNVQLRGMVQSGAVGTVIFTLPVGFRPIGSMQVPVVTGGGTYGVITLAADGTVTASVGNTASLSFTVLFSTIA